MFPIQRTFPVSLCVLVVALGTSLIFGQEGRRRNVFSQPPKNLKVLKVEKGEDLRPIMRSFDQALGVECAFCHDTQDFDKDTKPHKETARKMLEMVQKINTEIFTWEGAPKATCNMCHNGNVYPKFNPPQPPQQNAPQGPEPSPAGGRPPQERQ